MLPTVRLGFVGVGFMGQVAHLRHYAALDGCEVVALAEPRRATGELVAQRYGIPHRYDDFERMLAEQQLDGVVASQPFERHVDLLPRLFGRVRHVLTEKALANSTAGGAALVAAARATGTVHMVGYQKRCDPAVVAARAAIERWRETGEVGALRYVRTTVAVGDWLLRADATPLDAGDVRPVVALEPVPEIVPPGLVTRFEDLINFYVHQLNMIRHLLGERYELRHVDAAGLLYAGESESGATIALEARPYEQTGWEETTLVAFERGFVKLSLPPPLAWETGRLELYDGTLHVPPVDGLPAFRRQAEAFVAVCRGERAPPVDGAEALLDLELIEAAVALAERMGVDDG